MFLYFDLLVGKINLNLHTTLINNCETIQCPLKFISNRIELSQKIFSSLTIYQGILSGIKRKI